MRLHVFGIALASLLLACAGSGGSRAGEVGYGKSAEESYNAGLRELKGGNHAEATKHFEQVRTKFPFSRFAGLSELRLGDVKFDQGHWTEAAEAYKDFLKAHPTHEDADHAAFRVGLSYWKDAPSNFKLFPPSHEKDQQAVRDAVQALEGFSERYPGSKYRAEAEKILAEARGRLAEHEWYVAEFYAKRGHWAGAASRLETLVAKYPGSARESAALYKLAEAYVRMDERFRAQQALQQLLVKHPQSPHRADAERLLARIR